VLAKVVSNPDLNATISEVKYEWSCHDLLDGLQIIDYLDFIEIRRHEKEAEAMKT